MRLLAILAWALVGCQTTEMDPKTGAFTIRTFMMEHKTVCRDGVCSSCARGKTVGAVFLGATALLAPEVAVTGMVVKVAIDAFSDAKPWCEGFPELLKLPPAKPLTPAKIQTFRWIARECVDIADLDPEFGPVASMRWCPPGVEW